MWHTTTTNNHTVCNHNKEPAVVFLEQIHKESPHLNRMLVAVPITMNYYIRSHTIARYVLHTSQSRAQSRTKPILTWYQWVSGSEGEVDRTIVHLHKASSIFDILTHYTYAIPCKGYLWFRTHLLDIQTMSIVLTTLTKLTTWHLFNEHTWVCP